jgi:hypothetical protein
MTTRRVGHARRVGTRLIFLLLVVSACNDDDDAGSTAVTKPTITDATFVTGRCKLEPGAALPLLTCPAEQSCMFLVGFEVTVDGCSGDKCPVCAKSSDTQRFLKCPPGKTLTSLESYPIQVRCADP